MVREYGHELRHPRWCWSGCWAACKPHILLPCCGSADNKHGSAACDSTTQLGGAWLCNARLRDVRIDGAQPNGARLGGVRLGDSMVGVRLGGCDTHNGAWLMHVFSFVWLGGAQLGGAQLGGGTRLRRGGVLCGRCAAPAALAAALMVRGCTASRDGSKSMEKVHICGC